MLTCKKCATENRDGSTFCQNCGENLTADKTSNSPVHEAVLPVQKSKNLSATVRILATVIVVLVVFIGIWIINANKLHKIDSQLFCTVMYSGLNGYGTAEVFVDSEKFALLLDDFNLTNAEKTKAGQLIDTLRFNIPSNGSLSNNTEYPVTGAYDEPSMKKLKIEITGLEWTTSTEELMEPEILNPFEGFTLYAEGFEPYGTYYWDTSGCNEFVQAYFQFETDCIDGTLSNGDKITIRALYDAQHLIDSGYVVENPESIYEISGLQGYPQDMNGIDLSELNQALRDCLNSSTSMSAFLGNADYWGNSWQKDYELSYRESIFVPADDPYWMDTPNRFINFYNLQITSTCVQDTFSGSAGDVVTETIYLALRTDNLISDGQGGLIIDNSTSRTDWSSDDQSYEEFYQSELVGFESGYQVLSIDNSGGNYQQFE